MRNVSDTLTTKRADIHRPSAIDPVEYAFVGVFYQGDSEWMGDAYQEDHRELERLLGQDWHLKTVPDGNYARKFTCDHCGAHFAHGALYRHEPTGDLIAVGHICAATVLLPGTTQMDRKRKLAERSAKAAKTAAENADRRAVILADNPGLAEALGVDHHITRDISQRFHGPKATLSEKQIALVFKIQRDEAEKAVREAEYQAKATPVVEGKGTIITGEVVSTKWVQSLYGDTLKMLVLDDRGFKVWGTVPSALEVERHDRVSFTANTEQSHDDVSFGFFKRPRKSINLSTTETSQEEAA